MGGWGWRRQARRVRRHPSRTPATMIRGRDRPQCDVRDEQTRRGRRQQRHRIATDVRVTQRHRYRGMRCRAVVDGARAVRGEGERGKSSARARGQGERADGRSHEDSRGVPPRATGRARHPLNYALLSLHSTRTSTLGILITARSPPSSALVHARDVGHVIAREPLISKERCPQSTSTRRTANPLRCCGVGVRVSALARRGAAAYGDASWCFWKARTHPCLLSESEGKRSEDVTLCRISR